jgi:hypothetical protein
MASLVRRAAAIAALGASGLVLAGCGQAGLGGVNTACDHVEKGLRAYDAAAKLPASDVRRDALRSTTRREFMTAIHFAARAAVQNGHWTAFATSLAEMHRVGIDSVVPTLRMQCTTIRSGNYYY